MLANLDPYRLACSASHGFLAAKSGIARSTCVPNPGRVVRRDDMHELVDDRGGLRRLLDLLDLLDDKPEVGHVALVRCGLKLRVVARPQDGRRFLLVGNIALGGIAGGGPTDGGSGHGRNGCSSLPRTGFASRRATASCSSLVSRRT